MLNFKESNLDDQFLVDSDFLYLLAFSPKLQILTLEVLLKLTSQFKLKSRLCSLVFFFFFRKFVQQEKQIQSQNKEFNLKKFENPTFFTCLKLVSELLLNQIFHPNRYR